MRWLPLLLATTSFAAEIHFAALTLEPSPWDKKANFAKFERFARQARAEGAEVIVAPEGYLEGYVGNDKRTPDLDREKYAAVAEPINGPYIQRLQSLARELKANLMLGFAEKRGSEVFNSVVMFSPSGELLIHYSKTHTMNDEPYNTKGSSFPVVEAPFGKFGTLICFDRQLPETARILALKGARLLIVPAWGSAGEMNDQMMRVRAYENGVWLAFVHPRRALIINPSGQIIAQDTSKQDQAVHAQIILPENPKPGLLQYRRPGLYTELH